jgi:hypothetical protein
LRLAVEVDVENGPGRTESTRKSGYDQEVGFIRSLLGDRRPTAARAQTLSSIDELTAWLARLL